MNRDYQFAYVFCVNHKPVWSAETKESMLEIRFPEGDAERDKVTDFVETASIGEFIQTEYAMLFKYN
jgi:hypothetical protein